MKQLFKNFVKYFYQNLTSIVEYCILLLMKDKLNYFCRKKYILIGVPLLCGAIIGTTVTLSIPHVKAEVTVTSNNGGGATTIPTDPNSNNAKLTTPNPEPTGSIKVQNNPTNDPTTPPNAPTGVTNTQTGNTGGGVQPCH